MYYRSIFLLVAQTVLILSQASAETKHSPSSRFMSYEGRVMCGYQGWFRAEGDGSGEGWGHYGTNRQLDAEHLKVDLWPDVTEYPQTYPTPFRLPDGSPARVFSSWDASTVDLHFRWMKDYGIDGVFMQRFFGATRTPESRKKSRVILGHALKASQTRGRALAVMYDLSGLKATGEDCASVIQDWKELVDELRITQQLDYAPCVYPGFSWYNLNRGKPGGPRPLDQIPRDGGQFYWNLIRTAAKSGAKMLYVAMFDEIDEGTAIFKCANQPPDPGAPAKLLSLQGVPADHYLRLTGLAGRIIRGELPVTTELPGAAR